MALVTMTTLIFRINSLILTGSSSLIKITFFNRLSFSIYFFTWREVIFNLIIHLMHLNHNILLKLKHLVLHFSLFVHHLFHSIYSISHVDNFIFDLFIDRVIFHNFLVLQWAEFVFFIFKFLQCIHHFLFHNEQNSFSNYQFRILHIGITFRTWWFIVYVRIIRCFCWKSSSFYTFHHILSCSLWACF